MVGSARRGGGLHGERDVAGCLPQLLSGDSIAIRDTILASIIARDSSFRGYVPSYGAER